MVDYSNGWKFSGKISIGSAAGREATTVPRGTLQETRKPGWGSNFDTNTKKPGGAGQWV